MTRRFVGALLFLYPPSMRHAFGTDMLELAMHRRRRQPAWRFWWFFVKDLLRAAPQAHWTAWHERRGGTHGDRSEPPGPWRRGPLDALLRDLRLAFRDIRRSPGFTVTAIAMLALGIGANVAVFSALHVVLFRPPPYPDLDRLVMVDLMLVNPESRLVEENLGWSYPKFELARANADVFEDLAGFVVRPMTLSGVDLPARVDVEVVSPSYHRSLGVGTALGRTLYGQPEGAPQLEAVLTHQTWQTRYGADPNIIGRSVTLNGVALTVVGVAEPGFRGLTGRAELWVPMSTLPLIDNPRRLEFRFSHWFSAIGRIRAGISVPQARDALAPVGEALDAAHRWEGQTHDQRVELVPLVEARGNAAAERSLYVMIGAVSLVLLMTCANVAGLLLARAAVRRRDCALRAALGASRGRLLLQQLIESLVLAGLGGAVGVGVAALGVRILRTAVPAAFGTTGGTGLEYLDAGAIGLNATALAFAVALTAITGILFGLVPAWQATRTDLVADLRAAAGAVGHGTPAAGRSRAVLVTGQIAMAMVLLVGAGLMAGSFMRLTRVDAGFDPEGVLTFRYELPRGSSDAEQPARFHEQLIARLEQLPAVSAATIGCLPLSQRCDVTLVTDIEGRAPFTAGDREEGIGVQFVGDRHFEVLGMRLTAGRAFTDADRAGAPIVAVVNRAAVRQFFPDGDPIGRRFAAGIQELEGKAGRFATVVGVVDDVPYWSLRDNPFPIAYFSYRQTPRPYAVASVRTAGDPRALLPEIRRIVAELAPGLALEDVEPLTNLTARATADTRAVFWLLAAFAASAVALAALGIYGITAHAVGQRTRELGLRLALGAAAPQVIGMVLRRGLALAGIGIALGIAGAVAASRLLSSFLFETPNTDVTIYAGVAALLFSAVALAAYVPARRATRIDPVEALRE